MIHVVETLERIAAGLTIPLEELLVQAGYIDPEDYMRMKYEREEKEWSQAEQEQEPFALDFLLISNHPLYFQDKLLSEKEKAKIKSLIEIVLKD